MNEAVARENDRMEFLERAKDAALKSSRSSGLLPGVTVAQAVLESSWGESKLSREAHNYFGIKAHGKHESVVFRTKECDSTGEHACEAKFAKFGDMEECFACRDALIKGGKAYGAARACARDAEAFASAMGAKWATDPKYSEKLLRVYRKLKLDEWDRSLKQT